MTTSTTNRRESMAPDASQFQPLVRASVLASGSCNETVESSPDCSMETSALDVADVVFGAFMDDWCVDFHDLAALEGSDDCSQSIRNEALNGAVETPPAENLSPAYPDEIHGAKPSLKGMKPKSTLERRKQETTLLRRRARQAHARHQFTTLQHAAKESERLRFIVRQQEKLTQGLQRVLGTRIARATLVELSLLPAWKHLELGESPDDCSVYAKLLVVTDAMNADIDDVVRILQTRIPDGGNGSFRESKIAYFDSQDLLCAQLLTSEELPFSREQTSRALQFCLGGDNDASWDFSVNALPILTLLFFAALSIRNFGVLPGAAMDKRHASLATAIESGIYRNQRVRRMFTLDIDASVTLVHFVH
ncbi:hypothetical protein FI667_g11265, partial [Globisporangium splendens]